MHVSRASRRAFVGALLAVVMGTMFNGLQNSGTGIGSTLFGAPLFGAPEPGNELRAGRLQGALAAYPALLESTAGDPVDPEMLRGYLRLRHLNQGQPGVKELDCETRSVNCLLARQLARHYAGLPPPSRAATPMPLTRGESGHAVVTMTAPGPVDGQMVVDTGSVATILPVTLAGSIVEDLFDTRVENFGRLAPLTVVSAGPFQLGETQLPRWIAASSVQGFAREGVLGLDLLHALGGFVLDMQPGQAGVHDSRRPQGHTLHFLGGSCPRRPDTQALRLDNGVPVASVVINNITHMALIDTGSARSYVHDPEAGARAIQVRSDFGAIHMQGDDRPAHLALAGRTLTAPVIHTPDLERFVTGTTALIGADVLLSGNRFGFCFEPAGFWLE